LKPDHTKATTAAVNRWLIIFATLLLALPVVVSANEQDEAYAALRAQDMRLASVAERMLAANAPLCRRTMPLTGMILHSEDQYQQPVEGWFAQGGVAVLSVLAGSAADRAGMQENDALTVVAGAPVGPVELIDQVPTRDRVFDQFAAQDPSAPVSVVFRRSGALHQTAIEAPEGCYALVEILSENDRSARSDGRVIQVYYGLAAMAADQQLAVVFAHELAHSVLEHRRRLEEAGVEGGLLGEFGRNRRLARQVEVEADLLSVHLLANSGYDPAIAPQFWLSDEGKRLSSGLLRAGRYPSRRERAEMMEQEIAKFLSAGGGISMAEHLLDQREMPFTD